MNDLQNELLTPRKQPTSQSTTARTCRMTPPAGVVQAQICSCSTSSCRSSTSGCCSNTRWNHAAPRTGRVHNLVSP